MADMYGTKQKELSHKDIIWRTIEKIMGKALVEYKGGQKKTIIRGDWSETFIESDSRKEYIQGVEFLYDIYHQEITNLSEANKIFKDIEDKRKELDSAKLAKDDYILFKLEKMRELLRLIMKAIKDSGYFKTEQYTTS